MLKLATFGAAATTVCLLCTQPALAQSAQNWLTNEENKIQQDTGSGLINQQQAATLGNRAAHIQAQEQKYMSQNGGTLTAPENAQIDNELKHLNRGLHNDMRRDNPMLNAFPQGMPPGYVQPSTYYPYQYQGQWAGQPQPWAGQPQPWAGQPAPFAAPAPGQVSNFQNPNFQNPNFHHHHHRQWQGYPNQIQNPGSSTTGTTGYPYQNQQNWGR